MTSKSAGGAVGVDREERDRVLTERAGEVEPGRVGTLGDRIGAFVEDLVEDLEPLVGQPDLVGVRVDEEPGDRIGSVDRQRLPRSIPMYRAGFSTPARSGSIRGQRLVMTP